MRSLHASSVLGLALLAASCQPAAAPSAAHADSAPARPAAPAVTAAPESAAPGSARRERDEVVVFHLHKFLQRIGTERDTRVARLDGSMEAKATFSFRDRMTTVPLAASYLLAPSGDVRRYEAWGSTSRMTYIDERVDLEADGAFRVTRLGLPDARVRPTGAVAVLSGYAPVLGQELLVRAWNAHGRPATLTTLPEGTVRIEARGRETYTGGDGAKVTLEHLAVHGLVWGREDVWLDASGNLAALVTRDAEFDHFEAVREGFLAFLPELAKSTGADGVAWLTEAAKSAGASSSSGVLAFVGGQLVDGTGRPPLKDAAVIIDGDRIVAAGPRATTKVPPGATIVDVSGKSILPGLWDMHAHFEQVEQGVAYLAAGVTTVRDLGNVLEFVTGVRDAIASGAGLGPRLLVDGLVDGEGPASLGMERIASIKDIVPMLDRLQKAGCLEVKIYSSIAPDLVRPIAAEAHKRGMRVTGHVPTGMNVLEAIDAGFDGVNHLPMILSPIFPSAQMAKLSREERLQKLADLDLASAPVQRIVKTLSAKKITVDDTLALYELFGHSAEENARNEPGIAKLPRELQGTIPGSSDAPSKLVEPAFAKYIALLGELHRQGVTIVAGTDIAVMGHSLYRELELYVRAGFTPMEAIQAATLVPARVMKMDKELGTIEPGKRADVIIVAGDPLTDIHAIRNVVTVVARGKSYDSAKLWKLVGFSP